MRQSPRIFFEVNKLVRPEAKETMNWQWWEIGGIWWTSFTEIIPLVGTSSPNMTQKKNNIKPEMIEAWL